MPRSVTVTDLDQAVALLDGVARVAVLSGAGMSQESGVPTFRDAQTGLWSQFDATELATPEAFLRNPARVFGWYLTRWRMMRRAQPHAGHRALAALEDVFPSFTVITQNIDGLHRRAGSRDVVELHGSIEAFRCFHRAHPFDAAALERLLVADDTDVEPPRCACGSPVRPGVVWFGEDLPADALSRAWAVVEACDVMLVVGTSAVVYPAAALPEVALARGAAVIEINPEPTALSARARVCFAERAGVVLPRLAERLGGVVER
jgi:NAD-dependent deacetylase